MKTINVGRAIWFSREQVGRDIHGGLAQKGSPWARKVTGMILEGYDWEFSDIMHIMTNLYEQWENAADVLKNSGYYVKTKDDGDKVIGKKTRERQQEESEEEGK